MLTTTAIDAHAAGPEDKKHCGADVDVSSGAVNAAVWVRASRAWAFAVS